MSLTWSHLQAWGSNNIQVGKSGIFAAQQDPTKQSPKSTARYWSPGVVAKRPTMPRSARILSLESINTNFEYSRTRRPQKSSSGPSISWDSWPSSAVLCRFSSIISQRALSLLMKWRLCVPHGKALHWKTCCLLQNVTWGLVSVLGNPILVCGGTIWNLVISILPVKHVVSISPRPQNGVCVCVYCGPLSRIPRLKSGF